MKTMLYNQKHNSIKSVIKAVCKTLFAALLVLIFISTSTKVFAQTNWEKYFGNPVIVPGPPGAWDDHWIFGDDVLFDGTTYYMWYSSWDSVNTRIGYATSPDGINWIKYAGNPVLDIGLPGSWDESAVSSATVVYNESVYHMWYLGVDTSGVNCLGYATSPDRIVWTKYANNPVMDVGPPGTWDDAGILFGDVIFTSSLYQLWYTGWDSTNLRIGYATSPDGINWTKYAGNPVLNLGEASSWDTAGVTSPTVVYHNNTYHLWYSGGEEMQPGSPFLNDPLPGYATSSDGINWTKYAGNPISYDASVVSSGDAYYDGSTYHMWFSFCEWDGECQFRIHYSTSALTFTVNSTGDGGDINPGDGICDDGTGDCTLRAALMEANASTGKNEIAFDIPGTGPHTIQPMSELPFITDPVVIDGTTEPDFAGTPIVELDGTNAGNVNGLSIVAGNSTVRGLAINRFMDLVGIWPDAGNGISLKGNGSNFIEGNFIGTDITGMDSLGNRWLGVYVESSNNTIGGNLPGTRNVISGNGTGIQFNGSSASNNLVRGNYIGTDVSGTLPVPNLEHGIQIVVFASNNIIGGTTESTRNIISGNGVTGVQIQAGAFGNFVQGNFIGSDFTGTAALANEGTGGLFIDSQSNTIGGAIPGARNVISGNAGIGVFFYGNNAINNLVIGNYIGTDVTGTVALGNMSGIMIDDGASSNIVGGTTEGERNIISGNNSDGIAIFSTGTINNTIFGNYIGTDVTGTSALGNTNSGIIIFFGASSNTIGGTTEGDRNVISGNGSTGLLMMGLGFETSNNTVSGNFIGTDYTGMTAIPNLADGVGILLGASNNIVGGTEDGAGNVISGNQMRGVNIGLDSTNGNIVQGNYIGTDATGEGALGNGTDGVVIFLNAVDNLVGGDEAGAENVIAFNVGAGILLNNTSATNRNRLSRNSIFSNHELGIDLSVNPDSAWRDGITPNDPGDPDIGPNNLQNFPVITSADIGINGDLLIGYNVDSEPVNSTYPLTIEFFKSDTSGQGETFVGADHYTVTDFSNGGKTVNIGNASGLGIIDGDIIVATTTDSVGNTSEFSSLDTVVTDISEIKNNLPESYALYQNYPNPFNPVSIIKYDIPNISFVTLKVYDVLGSEVVTLVNEEKPIGSYEVEFNASDLTSGIYFYQLKAGDFVETKKMILMK